MTVRYERKYLVSNHLLEVLRSRILPFVRPDLYAEAGEEIPGYTVRSIYFDSPVFNAYHEKVEGLKYRRKLRIRGYNTYEQGCSVFLEIKRKLENRITKNRALVPYDTIDELLQTGDLEGLGGLKGKAMDEAKRFFYHFKKYAQQPASLVVYEREPYHGKFDAGLRVTFDKDIRGSAYPALQDLFDETGLTYLWERHFILEIKYFTDCMPCWLRSVIQEFGLRHEALSKYTRGIDKGEHILS